MTSEAEWIKARKARQLLIAAGIHHAEFQLRQALRIGQVHGRALHAEIKLRGRHGGKKEFRNWEVPDEVWKGGPDNSAFSLDGDFYSSGDYEIRMGAVKLTGLSFNKAELIDHFDIVEPPAALDRPNSPVVFDETTKDKGGVALDSEKWANFAAIAVVLQHYGGHVHKGMKKAPVYEKIADYASSLDLAIPSDTTVSKALDKMRQLSGMRHDTDGQPMFDDHGQPIRD